MSSTRRRPSHARALALVSRISFTLAGAALGGCVDQVPAPDQFDGAPDDDPGFDGACDDCSTDGGEVDSHADAGIEVDALMVADAEPDGAVIADAEWLNPQAQNALLRLLEEPPPRTSLVLVTTRASAIIPTIRSRSVRPSICLRSKPSSRTAPRSGG